MFYIYSGSTERFYNIRQHVNCESENVIYLVICKNFKIGSTSSEYKVRFRGFTAEYPAISGIPFFFLYRLPFIGLWFVSYSFLSYF